MMIKPHDVATQVIAGIIVAVVVAHSERMIAKVLIVLRSRSFPVLGARRTLRILKEKIARYENYGREQEFESLSRVYTQTFRGILWFILTGFISFPLLVVFWVRFWAVTVVEIVHNIRHEHRIAVSLYVKPVHQ